MAYRQLNSLPSGAVPVLTLLIHDVDLLDLIRDSLEDIGIDHGLSVEGESWVTIYVRKVHKKAARRALYKRLFTIQSQQVINSLYIYSKAN